MEVYKYFKEKKFKDDFLMGKIRLGTFSLYRGIENKHQGDAHEGISTYYIKDETYTPEIKKEIEKSTPLSKMIFGFASEETTVRFVDAKFNHILNDSYMVCATTERNDEFFKDDFGEHCIKIKNTTAFLVMVTHALKTSLNTDVVDYMDKVSYTKKINSDISEYEHPALTKHEHPYSIQKEFRFIWEITPPRGNLDIITIDLSSEIAENLFEEIK